MGGYNSGRHGCHVTIEGTASYSLDMTILRRAGLRPGVRAEVTIPWEDGFAVSMLFDAAIPANGGFVELEHYTRTTSEEPRLIRYRISLVAMRPPFGGWRLWWDCPRTGSWARKLYLPLGGRQFWSREGYRLAYASQRETRRDRLCRRARKLHRALGGDGEALGQEPPTKPRGMWKQTYERKLARWLQAEEAADAEFVQAALRILHWQ